MDSILVRDIDCEKVVLGTIMVDQRALPEIREFLSPNSFYDSKHKDVYKASLIVADRGDEVNIITILPELVKMGADISAYELTLLSSNVVSGDILQYALRLHDLEIRRKYFEIGNNLIRASQCEIEDIEDIQTHSIDTLNSLFGDKSSGVCGLSDTINELYEVINNNLTEKGLTGTPTGFHQIDDKGGLQASDLIIIAGATSQGKTSLAIAFTSSAIKHGESVAFYSMEMTRVQLTSRMVAMESGIPSSKILYGKLNQEEIAMVDKGVKKIYDKGLFFDDKSTSSLDKILCSIRTMVLKHKVKGVVIDYLQIMSLNGKDNDEKALAEAARRLKNIAKELNIWVIALSQFNVDKVDPVPKLTRLRGSGQIAEAADVVMLVYRPEYYGKRYPNPFENTSTQGTAMIDVAKGRNIGVWKFICGFNAATTRFYDMDAPQIEVLPSKDGLPF